MGKPLLFFPCLIELKRKSWINRGRREVYKQRMFCHIVWNLYHPSDKIIKGDGYCIHHIDGNKLNDNISNLEKLTLKEHAKLHSMGKNNNMYGKQHSLETRKKMSGSHIGFRHTEEAKRKMSERRINYRGENHPLYGTHPSEETKSKISKSLKGNKSRLGKYHTEETKRKMSLVHMGKYPTEETKRKMSLARKHEGEGINKC